MSGDWASLPVLPLTCVLEYLSLRDVLAATSACRSWRQALFLYNARRDTLKLPVCDTQRSLFLMKLFRRSVQGVHVYLDTKPSRRVYQYLQEITPKIADAAFLQEIVFIGPTYSERMGITPNFYLKRGLVEKVIHQHKDKLVKVGLIGCVLTEDKDYAEQKERFSDDGTIIKYNMKLQCMSSLGHMFLEYDMLSQELLNSLAALPSLAELSLQVRNKKRYQTLKWGADDRLQVSVSIIEVPSQRFDDIIYNILVEDLPLAALRVLFCKAVHEPLIKHVTRLYSACLREVEWTDAPVELAPARARTSNLTNPCINPFILICWRCSQLQKLIVHGYWVWEYDLLGMVRLRASTLQWLQVSATYKREQRSRGADCELRPVQLADRARPPDADFVQEMNRLLKFDWRPVRRWSKLHPALLAHSTPRLRAEYALRQITPSLEEFVPVYE